MRGAEGVVFALAAARKTRDTVQLTQRVHPVAATGQNLVRIGLMPDIPYDAVVRRIEHVMQGDGQFHRAEIGR